MIRSLAPLALAFTLLAVPASEALAKADKPFVRVTGAGSASAKPDIATISIGVVSDGTTAAEALEKNTAAMSRVMVELKGQKIEEKDIQTTNFSVNPRLQYYKDGKPPTVEGYQVVNSVRVIVRDLDNLGNVLDQAVSSGSNQMNGIQFGVDDPQDVEDKAREDAMADAARKAALYAKSAKAKLGKVMNITEGLITRPPPRPMFARAARSEAAPVPVAPGEQKISARVTVTYELKN